MKECCDEQICAMNGDLDQKFKCIFLFLPVLVFCAVELTLTEVYGVGATVSERSPDLEGIATSQLSLRSISRLSLKEALIWKGLRRPLEDVVHELLVI